MGNESIKDDKDEENIPDYSCVTGLGVHYSGSSSDQYWDENDTEANHLVLDLPEVGGH